MKHSLVVIGIVLLCVVVGVLSQLACNRAAMAPAEGPADVTVTLRVNEQGVLVKDLYPPQALVYCGHKVTWAIHNGTDKDVTVEMSRFTVLGTQEPKDPINFRETSISVPSGRNGSIRGTVKDKTMFGVDPRGKKDDFGEYQDFKYSLVVNGKTLDPEVRVRE
jgi:hypothetical protein